MFSNATYDRLRQNFNHVTSTITRILLRVMFGFAKKRISDPLLCGSRRRLRSVGSRIPRHLELPCGTSVSTFLGSVHKAQNRVNISLNLWQFVLHFCANQTVISSETKLNTCITLSHVCVHQIYRVYIHNSNWHQPHIIYLKSDCHLIHHICVQENT